MAVEIESDDKWSTETVHSVSRSLSITEKY